MLDEEIEDDLLPDPSLLSPLDWWHVQLATVACLIVTAAPLWYFVYLTPITPEMIAENVVQATTSSPRNTTSRPR